MPFQWTPINIAAVVAAAVFVLIVAVLLLVNRNPSMRGAGCDANAEDRSIHKTGERQADVRQLTVVKMEGCPACTALMPIIKQLQTAGTDIKLIDGPKLGMEWHRKNGVRAYPTVCLTTPAADGTPQVVKFYRGPRTMKDIATFAKETV